MKFSLVFLLGLFALALSAGEDHTQKYKVADKTLLDKQKQVLQLFEHINQPTHWKEHEDIAKSWSFNEHVDKYTKPEVVKHFIQHWKYGFLPKGEIFSVFHNQHRDQAVDLFKMFYYAKDYETFYKTAVWARWHVNEGMFLYAVSVAIVHRDDTQGIILPPIYEVYPHYFHNSDTIHQAYWYKQTHKNTQTHGDEKHQDHQHTEGKYTGYTVVANYSGHYLNLHPEQAMSYYLEDVGINAFYYYYNLHYPFWMDGTEFKIKNDKRGELYYYLYQQMLARFYMERISHDFGEIPWINWEVPVETPYYPSMEYPNGLEFPERPTHAKLQEHYYNYGQSWTMKGPYGYSYGLVHDFERRIKDVVDKGHVHTTDGKRIDLKTHEGINIIGNIIESNPDSPDHTYYGPIQTYARHLLGYSRQPLDSHHVAPSALEHFETSTRDPVFYQMYKKIIASFQRYYMHVPPYTENELTFPGVKITKVEVDPLVTYFDTFYSDISNAVYDTKEELEHDTFHIRAKQHRLNHKPFTYKITVNSDKTTKATVKVFMGPKYDEYGRYINITENRMNMVEIDHFVHEIKSGENVITRHSHQTCSMYGPDRTTYSELWWKVKQAMEGKKEFHIDGKENYFHFPQRYMLPIGSRDGKTYQIYVVVHPYKQYEGKDWQERIGEYYYPQVGKGGPHMDGYPLGWPFDRFIKYENMWHHIPNIHSHEVKIYHRNVEDINAPHHH